MEGTMSEIRLFSGPFEPKYWAYCKGQLLPINANQALFSLLGTTYGGDGISSFALPNLCGRVPVGTGSTAGIKSYSLGSKDGTNSVIASMNNMPIHTHSSGNSSFSIKVYSDVGDTGTPTGNYLASLSGLYSGEQPDATLSPVSAAVSIGVTGASQPISIEQPYLGMNYVICLLGIYPYRG